MTGNNTDSRASLRVLLDRRIVHNSTMKFRIGYGGPRQHRHGHYRPGGRRNNGGMSEVERLIHLIASMQILFGSRRGGVVFPLILIGLAAGGWYAYNQFMNPSTTLEKAHVMYDSSDTGEQMKAIAAYKRLLNKTDPLEPDRHWLRKDRDTLYRRIIQHEILNAENESKAGEWSIQAIEDGFTKLRFQDERVKKFWDKTLASFKQEKKRDKNKKQPTVKKQPEKDRNPSAESGEPLEGDDPSAEDNQMREPKSEPGKYDVLPGLDDVHLEGSDSSNSLALAN